MKKLVAGAVAFMLLGLAWGNDTYSQTNGSKPAAGNIQIILPNKESSVRFAVIGDTGTGGDAQQQLAEIMVKSRAVFPFEFALMLGDNLYGGEDAKDYTAKFEQPYKPLLDSGMKFYGALGNHDNSNQRFYKLFNMDGKEYYSFKRKNVRFLGLNSNSMDERQLKWIAGELANSGSDWKICFFHHPLYSSGKQHGSNEELQKVLEPLFVKHGVRVVFTGHEHFYERIKPQKGVYHFISGAGGKLRPGDVRSTKLTEKSYDQDLNFMLIEVDGDQLHFQVLTRTGKTVDSGIINREQTDQNAGRNP